MNYIEMAEEVRREKTWFEDTLTQEEPKLSLALFGGSGGLGTQLKSILQKDYNVTSFSSETDVTKKLQEMDYDILVNLVSINKDNFFTDFTEDDTNKIIDVNIKGNMNLINSVLPKMKKRGFGRIIYVSSVLSTNPIKGTSMYSSSKAFNDNLVKVVGYENAKFGVTCNSIQLGYFDGGLTKKVPEKILESVISKVPCKRLGSVIEIANAIKFIVDTEYFNSTCLPLNGGYV